MNKFLSGDWGEPFPCDKTVRTLLVDEGLLLLGREQPLHDGLSLQVLIKLKCRAFQDCDHGPIVKHDSPLQASLHQASLGPLPCLQPTRQPQGQPGQHVPEARIKFLTRQDFERTCFCFLGIGASFRLLILRFSVASFKKLWYCTLIPDIRILTGWLGSLQGFGQSVVGKGGLFHNSLIKVEESVRNF